MAMSLKCEIYQSTDLDYAIAEEFFGWKWMASMGIPVRSANDYPKERMVRQFFSPKHLSDPRWIQHWADRMGREADGTEDLSYRYCSSLGPAIVPSYSGDMNAIATVEKELRKRKKWNDYRWQLWAQIGGRGDKINEQRLWFANPKDRCIAALAVVGSKFVVPVEQKSQPTLLSVSSMLEAVGVSYGKQSAGKPTTE